MNFLAHLWLADVTGTSPAGAILGDFYRGAIDASVPADIALGIRIHRRVDAATDRDPLSRIWRTRFVPGKRRYAGIVLDLLCDHVLAQDWERHHSRPLADFADDAAARVADAGWLFEQRGTRRPNARQFSTLLRSYATWDGFRHALERTATRSSVSRHIVDAACGCETLLPEIRVSLATLLLRLTLAAASVTASS